MSDSERAIVAINIAARKKGMYYGQFVARASREELAAAILENWPREKKRKKTPAAAG